MMLSVPRQRQQDHEKPKAPVPRINTRRRTSEVERLAPAYGKTATRLCGLRDLIKELPQLGKVKAVTGNRQAVHEKVCQYQTVKLLGPRGYIQGDCIKLRLSLNHWHYGFAVKEEHSDGFSHSLQFFDRDGTGVHKIYLTAESHWESYQNIVSCYRSPDQGSHQTVAPVPHLPLFAAKKIDKSLFRRAWSDCQDIHDLPALFKSFGVPRIQGLYLAGRDLAAPVTLPEPGVFMEVLHDAALPVVFYVGNQGAIQSHSGVIKQLHRTGPRITALDNNFTLHMQKTNILQTWIVRLPASRGTVAAIELYNEAGENILQLFSQYPPAQTGYEIWQRLLATLKAPLTLAYSNTLQAV